MRQSTRKFLCPRVPLEAFIGSQSYVCNGELALFALGRLRFRPLRRRKLAKQPRWSEPGGAVSFGGWMRVGSGEFDMRAYMNSNLRIAGFQVFSVAKIAIVCLVCFSSDLRGFALHKSRRGRPQLLDPRPWCVWQTLATARSPKLTTPRPTRKLISRQERTQYLPLMQGSLNTEPASRFCRNLEDSAQGLRREPSSPSPGGAGERVQLAPNCNGSSRANGLALLQ